MRMPCVIWELEIWRRHRQLECDRRQLVRCRNRDEPNPNQPPPLLHHVPGASEDVSIPNNSGASTPFTVSYDGTGTVNTLAGDITAHPRHHRRIADARQWRRQHRWRSTLAGGAALSVAAGTLNVTGGTYSGTLAGNGTIQFLFGSFNLDAGVSITAANWALGVTSNGTVSHTNLDVNLTYARNFTLADYSGNHAVLELNGHTLTLSGTATFDGTIHAGRVRCWSPARPCMAAAADTRAPFHLRRRSARICGRLHGHAAFGYQPRRPGVG